MLRIYRNVFEAINETTRDLAELGIKQKRYFQSQSEETLTKEVIGYGFRITPISSGLIDDNWLKSNYVDFDVCLEEAKRRIHPTLNQLNEMFTPHYNEEEFSKLTMKYNGKDLLGYDYSERLYGQLSFIEQQLTVHPESRQMIAMVWNKEDLMRTENFRVPCSIFYHFLTEADKLCLCYVMRSTDIKIHFPFDITIACCMLKLVADKLNLDIGSFVFFTDNLHEYTKNLEGVF
jgi:thymidylate synthase